MNTLLLDKTLDITMHHVSDLSRTMAANFQSPEIEQLLSSSRILSVIILISLNISSSSCLTGGDIEKGSKHDVEDTLR